MEISYFFPAYHDEGTVEPLVREADCVLASLCTRHEIIVVDDGSPDRSGAIADRLARENPRVRVVHHPSNRGYGQAVWSGLKACRLGWIAFTDGDLQFDIRELDRFVAAAEEGADIVVGTREVRADGLKRALTSRIYNTAIQTCFGLNLRDVDCAFKLLRRSVVEGFEPSLPYKEAFLLVELIYRARRRGARVREVPVSHRARPHGTSRAFRLRTARRLAWYTLRGAVWGRLLGAWR